MVRKARNLSMVGNYYIQLIQIDYMAKKTLFGESTNLPAQRMTVGNKVGPQVISQVSCEHILCPSIDPIHSNPVFSINKHCHACEL